MIQRLSVLLTITLLCAQAQATLPYLGGLEIRGLNQASAAMNQISAHLGEDDSLDLAQEVAGLLGLPTLAGVDLDGTVRMDIFLVDGLNSEPAFCLTIPLADSGDSLLDALKDLWPNVSETDDYLLLASSPYQPSPIPIPQLYVRESHEQLRIANQAEALHGISLPLDSLGGVVALGIQPITVADVIEKQMKAQQEMMQEMFQHMSPEERAALGIDFDQMDRHQQISFAILRAFQFIGLAADLAPNALELQSAMTPTPNTPLDDLVRSLHRPSQPFLNLFSEDALWAHAMHFTFPESLIDLYLDFVEEFSEAFDDDGTTVDLLRQNLDLMRGQYAGDVAWMVLPNRTGEGLPASLAQVWRVTDPDSMRQAIDRSNELGLELARSRHPDQDADEYLQMYEPRTHRDIVIEGYSMDTAMGDPNVGMMLNMHAPFLKTLNIEYAFVGDVMMTVMGSQQQVMNDLIDRHLDGATPLTDFPALRALIPDLPADFVELGVIQPVELLQMVRGVMPFLPMDWLNELTEGQMAVAAYSRRLPGNMYHSVTRIDLFGLMKAIKAAQQPPPPTTYNLFDDDMSDE